MPWNSDMPSSPSQPPPQARSNLWQLFGTIVSPMHKEPEVLAQAMIKNNLVFYFSLPEELCLQQNGHDFLLHHEFNL